MKTIQSFHVLSGFVCCLILITANTEEFCRSYVENNQKMIVYNDADLNYLLFIIETKYWKIRVAENANGLKFSTEDKVPIGSISNFSKGYKFAVKAVYDDLNISAPNVTNLVAFYKERSFDFMTFRENSFTIVEHIPTSGIQYGDLDEITFAFHFRTLNIDPYIYTGLVSQRFDGTFNRTFRYFAYIAFPPYNGNGPTMLSSRPIEKYFDQNLNKTLKTLKSVNDSLEMMAILVTNKPDFYVIFRFNYAIKYCTLNECLKGKLQLLVDCEEWSESTTFQDTNQHISQGVALIDILVLCLVVLICIGIVALIVFLCKKCCQKKAPKKSTQRTKSISIHTIHSETGEPIGEKKTMDSDPKSVKTSKASKTSHPKSPKPKK